MSNPWARWRVRLGYPLAIGFAVLARPSNESLLFGGATALTGLLLRAAAAGHLCKHQRLAKSGPYRFTRNPLYLGSAFVAAGLLVAGRSWIATLFVAVYFAIFYARVMRSEEDELRALYGPEFDDYAMQVPLFLPFPVSKVPASFSFSWQQYKVNREYQAALGFLLGIGLLYAKMRFMP